MSNSPPTLELWLVRHGQTVANRDAHFSGHTEVPLTDRGMAEARALRPLLEGTSFDGVWSSDLSRAVETARLAFGEPVADARLRELDFGELEGTRWDQLAPEVAEALLAFDGFQAPGGESVADFGTRLSAFLAGLPPGRHLIVAHGGVVRWITRQLGLNRFLPNGVVVAVDWSAQRILFIKEPETPAQTP